MNVLFSQALAAGDEVCRSGLSVRGAPNRKVRSSHFCLGFPGRNSGIVPINRSGKWITPYFSMSLRLLQRRATLSRFWNTACLTKVTCDGLNRARIPQVPDRSTTMNVKLNAKLVAKITILAVVMIGTFLAASVQPVPSADGGPLILCPPKSTTCQSSLPTLRS